MFLRDATLKITVAFKRREVNLKASVKIREKRRGESARTLLS
jgi:hypothetical protein